MITPVNHIADQLAERIKPNITDQKISAEVVYDTLQEFDVDPASISLEEMKQILTRATRATQQTSVRPEQQTCEC